MKPLPLMPSISVIVPAYNEEEYISETLSSIFSSDYPSELLTVIVVDNNSSDRTAEIARKFTSRVLYLEEGNVGAVRNLGAEAAHSDVLIFIDGDCTVDQGWISRGVKLLYEDNNLVYGGPCKTKPNANWIERLWLLENPNHPRIQPDLLGSCIFIRAETFKGIGGFNEEMTSGEDSELSERLRNHGYKVVISSDLPVTHLGNPCTVRHFIKRQIWHSENYTLFLKNSIKDYMFWITSLFTLALVVAIFSIATGTQELLFLCGLTIAILPFALSLKRVVLTKYVPNSIVDITGIYLLDILYLIGRAIGLLKSIMRNFKPKKTLTFE